MPVPSSNKRTTKYKLPVNTTITIEERIEKEEIDDEIVFDCEKEINVKNISIESKEEEFVIHAEVEAVEETIRTCIKFTCYTPIESELLPENMKINRKELIVNFDTRHTLKHL